MSARATSSSRISASSAGAPPLVRERGGHAPRHAPRDPRHLESEVSGVCGPALPGGRDPDLALEGQLVGCASERGNGGVEAVVHEAYPPFASDELDPSARFRYSPRSRRRSESRHHRAQPERGLAARAGVSEGGQLFDPSRRPETFERRAKRVVRREGVAGERSEERHRDAAGGPSQRSRDPGRPADDEGAPLGALPLRATGSSRPRR